MDKKSCLTQMATNFGVGATIGSPIGALFGTWEAFRYKIPGLLKIRHIGQATLTTGAIFGTFLAAGGFVHCSS